MKISKLLGVACSAGLLFGHKVALADIAIGDSGATVDFTGFNSAGFSPNPTAGQLDSDDWAVTGFSNGDLNFGGTNTSLGYTRKTPTTGTGQGGPATTGTNPGPGIYNFYVQGTPNNVFLGVFPSTDDFTPGSITARFKNTRAKSIVKLQVAYRVLTWNSTGHVNTLKGEYSTDNATWLDLDLSVSSTAGAAATPAWVSTSKSTTIDVTIPVNGNFYIRWTGSDPQTGDGDSIGIDDIVLTPQNGCGDGVAAGSEGCDDGNRVDTDACTNQCQQAVCGDNIVRTSVEQCDGSVCCGAPNTANECKKLTGTTCQGGGTCNNGVCVGGGQAGDTGMAGDTGIAGDTGMAGDTGLAGEGGAATGGTSAAGRGGRGGRGGMGGAENGGVPAAGTAGGPAAGTAGAPPAGGSGGTAGTTASGGAGAGGTSATAGKGGSASGGKAGSSSGGKTSSSGGSGGSNNDDDSGCGCSVPRGHSNGTLALVAAGALTTLLRRRRRNR